MTTSTVLADISGGLDPRALITFAQVCRSGTLSAAARALNVTQPSVSSTISALEQRLGAKLFERRASGVELTEEGQALQRSAEALSSLMRNARDAVELAKRGIAGPLRIGGTPGALVSMLPRALAYVERTCGRVDITVLERSEAELASMLRSRDIELALVTTRVEPVPPDISEISVLDDPFAVIVGRAHDDLPSRVALGDLADVPWILPEAGGGFRRQIDALFLASEAPVPQDVIRSDSLLTTKAIVRLSKRVSILPRQVVASELSVGVLRAIEIANHGFNRSIGVKHLTDAQLSPLAQALLEGLTINPRSN